MSIQIEGSFSRGYADAHSDLESSVILPERLWLARAKDIEDALWHDLEHFAPVHAHGEFSPISFERQLHGHAMAFLEGDEDLPWEDIHVNTLCGNQTAIIVRDADEELRKMGWYHPDDIFGRWVPPGWTPTRAL